MSACAECGHEAGAALFCPDCNTIQPAPPDYFALFGIEPKLRIDPEGLQQRFYELSRKLHPDRFMRKSERERQLSLDASSALNDGYRTLRDPVQRAEYVLKQTGQQAPEQASGNVPPELLEEVFELNMALEEMRGGDAGARPELEAARAKFGSILEQADREMEELFAAYDAAPESAKLAALRSLLHRRKYITNLVREVEQELAK